MHDLQPEALSSICGPIHSESPFFGKSAISVNVGLIVVSSAPKLTKYFEKDQDSGVEGAFRSSERWSLAPNSSAATESQILVNRLPLWKVV
jgi:hypothetical protein